MKKEVLIIGAGVAGLYLGFLLKKHGFAIQILEAGSRVGGRIMSVDGYEAGALYIHGANSVLKELADLAKVVYEKEKGSAFFWINNKLTTRKQALNQPDFEPVDELIVSYNFKRGEINPKYSLIAEGFASIMGTSLTKLSEAGLSQKQALWSSGETNYVVVSAYQDVLNPLLKEVQEELRLNCAVNRIEIGESNCVVYTEKGLEFQADKVVVCVPLGVLKAKAIEFVPPLPSDKQSAIENLGFDAGAKVFLRFKEPFWPQELNEIYGGSLCPLYAVDRQSSLMAYLVGGYAAQVLGYGKEVAPQKLLDELDQMFHTQQPSRLFVEAKVFDWGANPYFRGAYCYPTPEATQWAEILATPCLAEKLFFAGEHTNCNGHQGTVHGAMESAEYCAKLIIENLQHV